MEDAASRPPEGAPELHPRSRVSYPAFETASLTPDALLSAKYSELLKSPPPEARSLGWNSARIPSLRAGSVDLSRGCSPRGLVALENCSAGAPAAVENS